MFRTAPKLALLCCLVFPSLAAGQDVPLQAAPNGALLRSGIAAVQRLPVVEREVIAAQMQQTKLQNDRKTTVIVVSVVAAATVIYLMYRLHHLGPFVSGHF